MDDARSRHPGPAALAVVGVLKASAVCGFFTLYLTVMTLAMLSPTVFDLVMGIVGLRFPESPPKEIHLLLNMNLCGLVPTAVMAARTAIYGEWTRVNRAFFLAMFGANACPYRVASPYRFRSIASSKHCLRVIAGNTPPESGSPKSCAPVIQLSLKLSSPAAVSGGCESPSMCPISCTAIRGHVQLGSAARFVFTVAKR